MFSKCQFFVKDGVLIFWGNPHDVVVNSKYSQALCRKMNNLGLCHTSCLSKFGHQTLNCPSIRYIVPAKISPALPLYQKNWFSDKVRLDDFYPLLRSVASTWIHIGVKRISQACCLHHLKNMEKNCKTQFWDEKQNRVLFSGHPEPFSSQYSILTPLKTSENQRFSVFSETKGFSIFSRNQKVTWTKKWFKKIGSASSFLWKVFFSPHLYFNSRKTASRISLCIIKDRFSMTLPVSVIWKFFMKYVDFSV